MYISGHLARKLAGLIVFTGQMKAAFHLQKHKLVDLGRQSNMTKQKNPLWRKAANRIFGYGHQSSCFSEYEKFFSSADKHA